MPNLRVAIDSQNVSLTPRRVILDMSVCMNAYILETTRARVTKFAGNMLNYCTQRMFVFEFDHAPFRCRKPITYSYVALLFVLFCRLLKVDFWHLVDTLTYSFVLLFDYCYNILYHFFHSTRSFWRFLQLVNCCCCCVKNLENLQPQKETVRPIWVGFVAAVVVVLVLMLRAPLWFWPGIYSPQSNADVACFFFFYFFGVSFEGN